MWVLGNSGAFDLCLYLVGVRWWKNSVPFGWKWMMLCNQCSKAHRSEGWTTETSMDIYGSNSMHSCCA